MRKINTLHGLVAGATLTLASVGSYSAPVFNLYEERKADDSANAIVADNSSTMRDEDAKPAMGGEGDGVPGGNAPNPDPDRSLSVVADDAAITAEVKTKLLADTTVSGLKIDVDTRSGVVYLTGDNMKSQSAIDQAMKLAEETDGVKSVVSRLAIGDIKS